MCRYIYYLFILIGHISNAQSVPEKNLDSAYKLMKVFEDKFDMYENTCSSKNLNEIASKIFITHKYVNLEPSCIFIKDSQVIKNIHEVLLSKQKLKNRIGFLHSVLGHEGTYYFYIMVFTNKSFRRYRKRKSKERVTIEHPTGEVKIRHKATLSKYVNEYIVINRNDSLTIEEIK